VVILDLIDAREELPVTKSYVYMDNAWFGPIPTRAVEEMNRHHVQRSLEGMSTAFSRRCFQEREEAREAVARFLNASPDEVAFTENATTSINIVAQGLSWKEGENIVISDIEHSSGALPWVNIARRQRVEVRVAKADRNGMIEPQQVSELVDSRTRIVSLSHVAYSSGARLPIKEIAKIVHERDALLVVDAAQSLGCLRVDLKELNCDFMAATGHKWLMGPLGTGILFCRAEALEKLSPAMLGWNSTARHDFPQRLEYTLAEGCRRFEPGTPNFGGIVGLRSSLSFLESFGVAEIESRVESLTRRAAERLGEISGVNIFTPREWGRRAGILSFDVDGKGSSDVSALLEQIGRIVVGARTFRDKKVVRLGIHFYTTDEEVDGLAAAVEEIAEPGKTQYSIPSRVRR
jgi:cysteine desulfurase/selenocysteine lyase